MWSHFQPIVDRSSLWSAEQEEYNSPYPRTCLVDLVSRERFDSLYRVSLLILHAQAASGAYSRVDCCPFFATAYYATVRADRVG